MHAVVVSVSIAPGQIESSRKALKDEVVPRVSKAPGFVKGYWTAGADATRGLSFVVFASEQDATNAAQMVRNAPPPAGVTMGSVEVREVIAEA